MGEDNEWDEQNIYTYIIPGTTAAAGPREEYMLKVQGDK